MWGTSRCLPGGLDPEGLKHVRIEQWEDHHLLHGCDVSREATNTAEAHLWKVEAEMEVSGRASEAQGGWSLQVD